MKWTPIYNRYWLEAKLVERQCLSRPDESAGLCVANQISKAASDAMTLTMWEGKKQEHTEAIAAYGWGGGLQRVSFE